MGYELENTLNLIRRNLNDVRIQSRMECGYMNFYLCPATAEAHDILTKCIDTLSSPLDTAVLCLQRTLDDIKKIDPECGWAPPRTCWTLQKARDILVVCIDALNELEE